MRPEAIYEAMLEPEGAQDPYPLYAALHAHGTVLAIGDGQVLVPGYHAANSILRDPRFRVDDAEIFDRGDVSWREHPVLNAPNLLSLHGAGHDRIRGLMPRRVPRPRVHGRTQTISAPLERPLGALAAA